MGEEEDTAGSSRPSSRTHPANAIDYVKAAFAAFGAKDWDGLRTLFAGDVTLAIDPPAAGNIAGRYNSIEAAIATLTLLSEQAQIDTESLKIEGGNTDVRADVTTRLGDGTSNDHIEFKVDVEGEIGDAGIWFVQVTVGNPALAARAFATDS